MATVAESTPAAAPASLSARLARVSPGWWIAVGWVALVALHVWIARGVTGPIVLQDESGYLGNARWLAGRSPVPDMGDQPVYAWGYSLLLVPLVWLVDDPGLLHRLVQVLNSLLLASLLPLLWVVLRRLGGAERRTAGVAALAGSVFPATLVHSSVAWAESLLPVLVVLLVLATWAALTERPAWQRVMIGPVAVFAYAAHPRFLPALALVAFGAVAAGVARRAPAVVAAANAAIVAIGVVLVRQVDAALLDARWADRVADEGSAARLLGRLVRPANWPQIAAGSVGQAWYLMAASLGLVAAGVVASTWWLVRGRAVRDARWTTIAFTAAVVVALFVTSVVSFVGTAERVDHLVYGRYNEAFVPLLVAAGALGLLTARGYQRARLVGVGAGLTLVLGLLLWLGRGPGDFTGPLVWNNVLGLRLVTEVVGQRWMVPVATLVAVAALGVVSTLDRRPTVGVAGVAAALVVSGAVAVGPLADFARVRYDGWQLPEHLARVAQGAEVDSIGLDRDRSSLMASLGYPFWSPDLMFRFTDRWDLAPPLGLVVSAVDDHGLSASGARIVVLDARNHQAVWALVGTPAFDRLADAGALLPLGFPAELDRGAQLARIASAVVRIEVEAGETFRVVFDVTHAGTAEAWPSDVEWPVAGVVRAGVRWYDEDGDVVRSDDRGRLSGPMWPGDEDEVLIELRAVDADGRTLAPGTYTLGIDLLQEGFAWFAEEGAEALRLEVVVY